MKQYLILKFLFQNTVSNNSPKDRNRKGGGVACYIRSDICLNSQNYFCNKIENISFDLLLPKAKPISINIGYKLPTDNDFLDNLSKGLNDFNLMENYVFIDVLNNGEKILNKYKDMSERKHFRFLL